jgi:hypothetical protein
LATRSWRAPCVISESRLMTRSAFRSRSNFNRARTRARTAVLRTSGPQPPSAVIAPVPLYPLKRFRWRSREGPSWVVSGRSPRQPPATRSAPIPDLPSLATERGGFDPRVPRFPHEACFCHLSTKETGPAGRTDESPI